MDCERCDRAVCPNDCPFARAREIIYICAECGDGIHEGDGYYRVAEETYCGFCVENMHFIV